MKLHHVLFILFLIGGIVAVVCTYLFGILPRHEHYQVLQAEEEQLRDRIGELEKRFSRTQPAAVVRAWQEQVQPWAQAVSSRITYFDTLAEDDRLDVVVPEEEKDLPKFWYARERERRLEALSDEAFNAGVAVSARLGPYEPPAPGGPGWNPTAEEVETWLENYERAASFVREMIHANADEIVKVEIWPSEVIMQAPEGTVHMERVGYSVVISMEDFAKYLAQAHTSDTFVSISGLSIAKSGALSDPEAPIEAEFVLERTRFVPTKTTTEEAPSTVVRRRSPLGAAGISTGGGPAIKVQYSEEELARIRAASAEEEGGFFRLVRSFFGL